MERSLDRSASGTLSVGYARRCGKPCAPEKEVNEMLSAAWNRFALEQQDAEEALRILTRERYLELSETARDAN